MAPGISRSGAAFIFGMPVFGIIVRARVWNTSHKSKNSLKYLVQNIMQSGCHAAAIVLKYKINRFLNEITTINPTKPKG